MKLSDLRASIRKSKGNPSIVVALTPGVPMTLVLQKTPLLEELAKAYGSNRATETGLTFDEGTGVLGGVYEAVSEDEINAHNQEAEDDGLL